MDVGGQIHVSYTESTVPFYGARLKVFFFLMNLFIFFYFQVVPPIPPRVTSKTHRTRGRSLTESPSLANLSIDDVLSADITDPLIMVELIKKK